VIAAGLNGLEKYSLTEIRLYSHRTEGKQTYRMKVNLHVNLLTHTAGIEIA
jgi:hypothetical protein